MYLKDVYSIRLNKKDTLIKEYLKQYPVSVHTFIIKDLITQGIHTRQNNVQGFESTNEKLEEVLTLLRGRQILGKNQLNLLLKEEDSFKDE
jgi:hypothetical protein